MKSTIAIDVDGTVADLHTPWLARYNRDFDDTLTIDKITDWALGAFVKPECGTGIFEYLHDPSIYDDVKPIPGALNAVLRLRNMGHRVIFVTSCNKHMSGRKFQWLADNGFIDTMYGTISKDYVEAHDKSLIRADVLIDDYAGNFAGFRGDNVLFLQPWNKRHADMFILRFDDWSEFPALKLSL